MAERLTVGVRFCGGCNPRYDRVAAVKKLERQLPQVAFEPADSRQPLTLLICGCSAQCVCRDDLEGACLSLYQEHHFDAAALRIQTLEKELDPHGLENSL